MYFVSQLLQSEINNTSTENVDQGKSFPSTSAVDVEQPSDRHVWQYAETVMLIRSVESHFEEFSYPKKRKHVFENVSNDLLSEGCVVSANNCQTKWKSLNRSYSVAKDNKNKTGRGPSRFQFFEEMDAILGTKPSNHCEHTLESLDNSDVVDVVETEQTEPEISEEESKSKKKKRMRTNYEGYLMEKEKIQEKKNKRHADRMEIEKMKLEVEKEKINLLKQYLERGE